MNGDRHGALDARPEAVGRPATFPLVEPTFFRSRWWIVFASTLALIVSQGSINIFAFAVFLKPVTEDLGIGRGTFSSGMTLGTVLAALASPIVGRLFDRHGIRSVLLCGIVLFAIATAAMGLLQSGLVVFYGLFAFAGLTATTQLPTGYAKAVSEWFDKERGLALGIAIAGAGLGVALIPPLAARLIQSYGWRTAYVGLGITIFLLAFAPIAAFMRDAHPRGRARRPADQQEIPVPGLTAVEVIKGSWRFWALVIVFLFVTTSVNGILTHIVAMLTDRGIPAGAATAALSAAGLAVIGGRVVAGYLLDRFFGRYVALFFFVCPMIGIALLAIGSIGYAPFIGTLLCGLAIGAELDFMAFFTSRYFGLSAFGEIYGYMMATLVAASGLGSYVMGLSYDLSHSYWWAFVIFEVLLAVACSLIAPLGPYRFPAQSSPTRPELK
jgi:MFS family permease